MIRGYKKKTKPALWTKAFPPKRIDGELEKRRLLYARDAKAFIADAQRKGIQCPVTGGKVTQNHHKRGRLGALLMDKRFWIPVSARGHRKIHDAPDWARANGLLAHIGEWNMPVPA